MQATMREAKTLRELPFAMGVFQGRGIWADQQQQQGNYLAEFKIIAEAGGVITHVVSRVFLKEDGSALYEEDSRVRFTPTVESFFDVVIRHEGKECRGQGGWFGNRCHYDVSMTGGLRLNVTYTLSEERIQLLGSSAKNGNLTVWAETLTRRDSAWRA
ncbi:MAG: hypothetical protein ABI977_05950 [Acidobacteriota bacterium]